MTTKAPKRKKGVLPSGNVRVQVYLYTDDKESGITKALLPRHARKQRKWLLDGN